jgi:hypothetical protein
MLANGTGFRQFATRIALYCEAKEARSADEVPGMPLASDAPGAPAVDPPIAGGHTGAGGGVGVGVDVGVEVGVGVEVTAAGVVVNVRPETLALVDVAETEVPCAVEVAAAAVAVGVEFDVELGVVATAAGAVLLLRSAASAAELPAGAAEPATTSALAREGTTLPDGPAPWIRITATTTVVARTTAFFNVCTPIQRLHCPPN